MTVAMPNPVPLEMPLGDAGALTELARHVAAAAFCHRLLDEQLIGAAASAPGWLGDDAAAAAAQGGAVGALVGEVSSALRPAIGRLDSHAERVLEARRQVAALVAERTGSSH